MERNKGKRLGRYVGDYVVFDLETTGINPERDSIIEISALKVKDHRVVEEFSTLVNPGRHIPAGATAVNGITDDMVADAPLIEEVLPQFLEFCQGCVPVAHNAGFDMSFIMENARRLGLSLSGLSGRTGTAVTDGSGRETDCTYVDTVGIARGAFAGGEFQCESAFLCQELLCLSA